MQIGRPPLPRKLWPSRFFLQTYGVNPNHGNYIYRHPVLTNDANYRAGEALAVVVVIHGFNPTIARLDGVAACETLGREQLVPVWCEIKDMWKPNQTRLVVSSPLTSLTVGESVLQVEVAVAKQASAVSTGEAFRVELLTDGVQAIL